MQSAAATSPVECWTPLPAAGNEPAGTQLSILSTALPQSLTLSPWPNASMQERLESASAVAASSLQTKH